MLTDKDFAEVAASEGVEVALLKTVAEVESAGSGFLPDGRPKILFEGHKFYANLPSNIRDRASRERPDLCFRSWTRRHYKGGAGEWDRLAAAIAYDREAALKSASWGAFQIMGENHAQAGYRTVQRFVNAMYAGAKEQLQAAVCFIKADEVMFMALKAKDWRVFARRYNGPAYEVNSYHTKLANAYKKYGG